MLAAGRFLPLRRTARLMHSRHFANLPDMNGMALGFYEETTNGHRIIGHAGDTQYFHSDLHLILDARVGLFLSYNSAGKSGTRAREAVRHAFLDRYCPRVGQVRWHRRPPWFAFAASPARDARLSSRACSKSGARRRRKNGWSVV